MATAKIHHTSLVEAQERHGTIVRVVMRARVLDLVSTNLAVFSEALSAAGVPSVGDTLTGYSNLVLTERNPKIVDGDPSTFDVDCVYEHFFNEGQSYDDPPVGFMAGEARANVQQVSGNTDLDGNTITVSHTFPSTDPDFPDETQDQGGEIQFFQPSRTLTVSGIKQTSRPWIIANSIIGRVNKGDWLGEPEHEWMCVGVSWKIHDAGTAGSVKYFMSFEFQHNPDTWNPTAIFIDERTGKPPKDLVLGTGIKYIRRHEEVNFEQVIGTNLQGG